MNNFRRFIVVSGLTLTLVVETITGTVLAQPAQAQQQGLTIYHAARFRDFQIKKYPKNRRDDS
ncbi:MAG: hypothetical protein V7K14_27735 [Nostoc sp.]|uniref:hypothetical protein n=1 Tax=Nostoc sp. TaxID=1180 RepID=UPI002FF68164